MDNLPMPVSNELKFNDPSENCNYNLFSDLPKLEAALSRHDYSLNSKRAIISDVGHFIGWYEQHSGHVFQIDRVIEREIMEYKTAMESKRLSAATINRRITTLRTLFDIAIELGIYTRANPTKNVRQLERQKLAPKSLTDADARQLLKEIELHGNLRDRTIVELMIGAGLRVSEVASLRVTDIEVSERKGILSIHHSKAGRSRLVPLNLNCRQLLAQYIEQVKPQDKLFTGQRDTLTAQGIRRMLARYSRYVPNARLTPHVLRHTFASRYLKQNPADIVALAQTLGHSSISTTQIYTQNRMEDLQEKVDRVAY